MAAAHDSQSVDLGSFFEGFSKLNRHERLTRLQQMGVLSADDCHFLKNGAVLKPELAEHLIENVIGNFHIPLGVATNFCIDGKDRVIPMAVEETSIIAAASKTARWIRQHGSIQTSVEGDTLIGQIQFAVVHDFEHFERLIVFNKQRLIQGANQNVATAMQERGGGVKNLSVRRLLRPDGLVMGIVHVSMDTCDAMGANIINQVCEYLKKPLATLTNEIPTMCILSNLNDEKITKATVTIKNIDPVEGYKIQEASLFAMLDPYRAATHNKGVMNGIDAVLIATGNDWRAVEAGLHAYATRDGHYQGLTSWKMEGNDLVGVFKGPLIVGTIGGVTKLHPTAQLCLNLLQIHNANDLARVAAAVGLVQNLGALRALTSVGIIEGHMKLHIVNLTLGAGAKGKEIPLVKRRLEEIFTIRKRISLTQAMEILQEHREKTALDHDVSYHRT